MDDLKAKIYDEIKMPQLMPVATITEKGSPWVRYVVGFAGEDLSMGMTEMTPLVWETD